MKKALRKLLNAVEPLALVAPFYDMKQTIPSDEATISVGNWVERAESGLPEEFNGALKLRLKDFRKLARAFTKVKKKIRKKQRKINSA